MDTKSNHLKLKKRIKKQMKKKKNGPFLKHQKTKKKTQKIPILTKKVFRKKHNILSTDPQNKNSSKTKNFFDQFSQQNISQNEKLMENYIEEKIANEKKGKQSNSTSLFCINTNNQLQSG